MYKKEWRIKKSQSKWLSCPDDSRFLSCVDTAVRGGGGGIGGGGGGGGGIGGALGRRAARPCAEFRALSNQVCVGSWAHCMNGGEVLFGSVGKEDLKKNKGTTGSSVSYTQDIL